MNTISEYLEHWSGLHPDKRLFSFLDIDGKEREGYTYLAFHERTRHLAQYLSEHKGLKRGDRVLLVYPPGLELIVAFYACARVGVVPVPVYPPAPMNLQAGLSKLLFVSRDCQPKAALTTRSFYRSYQLLLAKQRISSLWLGATALPEFEWVTTDDVRGQATGTFRDDPGEILFLQYTSGSTSDPKGVIVSQENVLHNCVSSVDFIPIGVSPIGVSWLPQYHDMGLIGHYLFSVIFGATVYGFSPLDFLKKPALWLQTISRVKATYTCAPNFGYEYCLREDKLPRKEIEKVDLSSLRAMMNGAEPVRAETHTRFLERYTPYGLNPEALFAAYGLAENTLAVSHHGRRFLTVNKKLLQQRTLHIEVPHSRNNNQLRLVSCGKPVGGTDIRIVDPASRAALGDDHIGEIWVAGKSACRGYWNRPELSEEIFRGAVANDPNDRRAYLRTGDLGFVHEGEVYVGGRLKDLIIIRGVNYYPQDIETIVEGVSRKIRRGCVAAFDVDADSKGEALVVAVEVRNPEDLPDPVEIARAIRTKYYIEPQKIAFVGRRTLPKTTSGKLSRSRTRQAWLNGELPLIATWVSTPGENTEADPSPLRRRFRYILELYNLTGREEYSFSEIGIDSLTMVELLSDIKKLLEEYGAGELAEEVGTGLLQRLTIGEFFSLLDKFENPSREPIVALRHVLRRIQEEHRSYERECMRTDAVLERFPRIESPEESRLPVTNVLLTGATGFFGPFLLNSLLRETPLTLCALIRASDPDQGLERIRAGLRRSRIWTPFLEGEFEKRVSVVCGDLTKHNLGLRSDEWRSLATQVQAVLHNGAVVNYVLGYDALGPHNVGGTRELLRFAFTGTPKAFHFVSSTFIFGWTVNDTLREADCNQDMENLDFGYAQSKWVAEQLVFAAGRQGLPVRVYRPSLISPSADGVGSKDDVAIRLLAFMIKHGIAVEASNQISFLPADLAAHNIATLFQKPPLGCQTLHLTADNYYNIADVTRLLTRDFGYEFEYHDIPGFVAEMNRRCTKEDLLYPLLDFVNRSHSKISAMQHKRYNNDQYRQARRQSGGRRDPELAETVSYLMAYLRREGLVGNSP
jgi:thioester reductase-like protein